MNEIFRGWFLNVHLVYFNILFLKKFQRIQNFYTSKRKNDTVLFVSVQKIEQLRWSTMAIRWAIVWIITRCRIWRGVTIGCARIRLITITARTIHIVTAWWWTILITVIIIIINFYNSWFFQKNKEIDMKSHFCKFVDPHRWDSLLDVIARRVQMRM